MSWLQLPFAEEGEHETAREFLREMKTEARPSSMVEQCKTAGIAADMQTADDNLVSAVNSFLKQKKLLTWCF